jgi:hypothetical protein
MSSQTAGDSWSRFNYDELYTATDGFAPFNVLGEGDSGHVYKGKLPSGQAVAVKQLTITGTQGDIQNWSWNHHSGSSLSLSVSVATVLLTTSDSWCMTLFLMAPLMIILMVRLPMLLGFRDILLYPYHP